MSNLVIVAIPEEDDYVHKLSSEKVAHCTLLFLGDIEGKPVLRIAEFLQHAVNILEQGPFGLEVDHRGTLGPDDADVLFFKKNWGCKRIAEFRGQLLKNTDIRNAYDSTEQFPEWLPHLTLGYPKAPAKEDKRDYPGVRWVEFNRIALWFGDFEGPEFRLEYNYDLAEVSMSAERGKEFLSHYGIKGMRWGVRRSAEVTAVSRPDAGVLRRRTKVDTKGGQAHEATPDAIKAAVQKQKLKKSGAAALSNQELRELATRLQLENQVQVLASSKGKAFVKKEFENQSRQQAQKGIKKGATTVGKTAAKVAMV